MKKLFATSLLLFFLVVQGMAQERINTFSGSFDMFTTDKHGDVYLVEGEELRKYSKKGRFLYRYSDKNLGPIESVDVSNALKPVLFYRSLSRFVVLDNTLSVQGSSVPLEQYGLDQAILVCTSINNHFWFYDVRNMELIRVDRGFAEKDRTGSLARILDRDFAPVGMLERNNRLYVNDPDSGILVFDIYGTYIKTLPLKGVRSFQVLDREVIFTTDKGVFIYDMRSFGQEPLDLPLKGVDRLRVAGEHVFMEHEGMLHVYHYETFPP